MAPALPLSPLGQTQNTFIEESLMINRVPRAWRRAVEILRWRGPGHFFLLTLREILRPLIYWYAWNIYLTDLNQPLTQPYAKGKFDVRIFAGENDREIAREQLASLGEPLPRNFVQRIARGDALAIVYCATEPVAFGWMTFCSGMELAYGTTWILQANEGTQYGSFVLPKWRGHGIFSLLNVALNTYAREHGIMRSVGSISVLNTQSLSMAKRLDKKKIMTVILVHVRGVGWTFRKTIGAPLHTRFAVNSVDLGQAAAPRLGLGDRV
jgi:GNAT superfamily N-acetyltransferase